MEGGKGGFENRPKTNKPTDQGFDHSNHCKAANKGSATSIH